MEIKAKYFFIGAKMRGVETEWLGGVTEAGRPVLRGLEVILQILRLGDHFCGDHGASAPPPSFETVFEMNLQELRIRLSKVSTPSLTFLIPFVIIKTEF